MAVIVRKKIMINGKEITMTPFLGEGQITKDEMEKAKKLDNYLERKMEQILIEISLPLEGLPLILTGTNPPRAALQPIPMRQSRRPALRPIRMRNPEPRKLERIRIRVGQQAAQQEPPLTPVAPAEIAAPTPTLMNIRTS